MAKRPPTQLKELVSYQLASYEAAQAKLKEKENDTGETTLRITSIYGQFAVSTSLGDTMLLITRRDANGTLTCTDPSENKSTELDSERDSGGCLGANSVIINKLSGPDLRSLTVTIVSIKPGDMLHVLSDGTYSCFDPFHLGIKPKEVDPSLKEESWDFKNHTHNRKRQAHIKAAFLRTINECQKPEEVAAKLNAYTEAATSAYKLAMITGQTPLPPSKADHANSVHVQIISC